MDIWVFAYLIVTFSDLCWSYPWNNAHIFLTPSDTGLF